MKIEKFEDIKSWQKARELVKLVYSLTREENFRSDFSLRDQIQQASVSVMSNIAEGFDSGTQKSFINFLNYSYRSTSEVQSLLYVAIDLNYVSKVSFDNLYNRSSEIKKLIGGFIQYLKTTKN